jgi:hypothetical protein
MGVSTNVNVHEAKTRLSQLLSRAEAPGMVLPTLPVPTL